MHAFAQWSGPTHRENVDGVPGRTFYLPLFIYLSFTCCSMGDRMYPLKEFTTISSEWVWCAWSIGVDYNQHDNKNTPYLTRKPKRQEKSPLEAMTFSSSSLGLFYIQWSTRTRRRWERRLVFLLDNKWSNQQTQENKIRVNFFHRPCRKFQSLCWNKWSEEQRRPCCIKKR